VKTGLKIAPLAVLLAGTCAWAQAPQTAAAPTQAAAPLPPKIAVINMQEALISTSDGKKAVADLRAKYGPRDQEFQKRSQDLQALQDKYRRTQATLSDEQKTKMERDIDSMTKTLERDTTDTKQDMDADQQRVLQELGGKIMQVVTRYAADNQYTMVFDDSGQPNNILFASVAIDITRDVIALYDKSAPVTPTAPPAAPAPKPAATTTSAPRTQAPPAPKPAAKP
jgi:outer membrane protein